MSSGPFPGLTRVPSTTVQAFSGFALSAFQPVRSLPLNIAIGFPHAGAFVLFNDGARFPVQDHEVPSGAVVVPESVAAVSLPSKTMSRLLLSSSFGETNVSRPADNSTLGRGRELPQRPTI